MVCQAEQAGGWGGGSVASAECSHSLSHLKERDIGVGGMLWREKGEQVERCGAV